MKKILSLILVAAFVTLSLGVIAQPPPPPDPSGGANPNTPVGATAPVGSGMLLLIGMAGLYGGKKVYTLWQNKEE